MKIGKQNGVDMSVFLAALSLNGLITVGYLPFTSATQRETQQQTENNQYSSIKNTANVLLSARKKCFFFCFTKLVKTTILACYLHPFTSTLCLQ